MKLAIVVQRYGADISGGAELHARYIAERLSAHVDVRVLTTCARDYLTWRNEFPSGTEYVNGVPVERFPVLRERDLNDFGLRQQRCVRARAHAERGARVAREPGPGQPGFDHAASTLGRGVRLRPAVLCACYQTYYGARVAADRAVLVPTAEREPALGVSMFQPIFRGVRGIMSTPPRSVPQSRPFLATTMCPV